MAQAPSNTPDPAALNSSQEDQTPLSAQAVQQNLISILESEDHSGININGILGGLPVAEKNQEYFLIIEEAGDTTPEIIDQTQFKISYLCDSQLNVSKPSGDGISLANVTQNFERQKNAVVRVDQGTVLNNQLAGTHKITAVGSVEPIAGTQIGLGPLDYVTTMSFQLKGQLGAAPGVEVLTYYVWLNKSVGFQNMNLAYAKSGTIPFTGNSWSNPIVSESNSATPFRQYFDANQISTGSAVTPRSTTATLSPPTSPSPPAGIADANNNYFNEVLIDTGSFQGNTRIKIKGAFGINIASSSVFDLFASAVQLGGGGGEIQEASTGRGSGGNNAGGGYNFFQPITLNLYHKSGGTSTLVGSGQKSINTRNLSLANNSGGGLDTEKAAAFSAGGIGSITDFDHKPDSVAYLAVESDYFSVQAGDTLYTEIVLPNELSSSATTPNVDTANHFTASLNQWRNDLTYRKYGYFGGYLILNQETPEGSNFFHGVTGVTASYFTTGSGGTFPSQSVYNNTGSYWIGYNNFTSSLTDSFGQQQSFITASTPLSLFYGGDYVQVNPGIESYNTVNAANSISSSLGSGLGKQTWERFGFNPIQKTFTPQPGDFIRFEFSKTKTFQILKVISGGNVLKLLLDGHIDDGTVVDNFVIYRVVEDGQFIILDIKKNIEVSTNQKFTGLVTPQFPSTTLQEKSNTLIFELKQSGIITN